MVDKRRERNYTVVIGDVQCKWDTAKNAPNLLKHGVGFEEAATVFADSQYQIIEDPEHSENEERFIALGISTNYRILTVCHTVIEDEREVRIFSARQATVAEETQYGGKTNARRV